MDKATWVDLQSLHRSIKDILPELGANLDGGHSEDGMLYAAVTMLARAESYLRRYLEQKGRR